MATVKSAEITAKEASSGEKYSAQTNAGVVKRAAFNITLAVGNTPIECVELEQGAEVQYVTVNTSAAVATSILFSTSVASVGVLISTTSAVVAGNTGIGDSGVLVGADGLVSCAITGTISGTPTMQGYVYYIVDAV